MTASASFAAPARIVIASRESPLALWQAEHVRDTLGGLYKSSEVVVLGMTTLGDQILDRPLATIGGKGLFIKEQEVAMAEGRADLAVHSMKDVPMVMPEGFMLAAISARENPRDALVSNKFSSLGELPAGSVVGTSSLRREAMLRSRYPHLEIKSLRGNLGTRLRQLDEGQYDAIILAAAGLIRLGLGGRINAFLTLEESLPAPGQGALGIEVRSDRPEMAALVQVLNDPATNACVTAERSFSRALGGSCQVPLGGYAELREGRLWLRGFVATADGRRIVEGEQWGAPGEAEALGLALAVELRRQGGDEILAALGSAKVLPDPAAVRDHEAGLVLLRDGCPAEALPLLDRAALADPAQPQYAKNAGNALRALGRDDEAAERYERALAADPDYVPALNNLAVLLRGRGGHPRAEALLRRALAVDPADADLWTNLGVTVQECGRRDEAVDNYRQALQRNPDDALAWFNLALALNEIGAPLHDIEACCREAARLMPGQAGPHAVLGRAAIGRKQYERAIAALRIAVSLAPEVADHHADLGIACIESGHNEEALRHFSDLLALLPDDPFGRYQMALALHQLGRHEEAIPIFDRLIASREKNGLELTQVVWARLRGAHWEGLRACEERLSRCWENHPFSPFTSLVLPIAPLAQRQIAERFADYRFSGYRGKRLPVPARQGGNRIRIGYYSADFREHPAAYLTAELFDRHDRTSFEVIALAYGPDDSGPMRRRIRQGADQFHDLSRGGSSDAIQAASFIAGLGIDVLIDLTGYTFGNWQEVLALRPAPVQVSYLGYLGTSGSDYIDYLVSDTILTPPGCEAAYSEALVRLPWYQANDRLRRPDVPVGRAELGLPESAVVLANLGQTYKIRPEVFDVWMNILRRCEAAVLWLQGESREVRQLLGAEAARRGIAADRLIFFRHRDQASYLGSLRNADVFLDTAPYNAGATGSDALWMGVPLVSVAGDTFSSRYGASLLGAAGLPELLGRDWRDYEEIAVVLAKDPARRQNYRRQLDARDSRLFDTPAFLSHWESALRTMVERQRAGLPPAPITVV